MGLAQLELKRQGWSSFECGCGDTADHLVPILCSAVDGRAPGAFRAMDGHVVNQSILMPPAPAVCAVAMAMLADGLPENQAPALAWLLGSFASGEEDGESAADSLYWACFETIRDGLSTVYREFTKGHGSVTHGYFDDVLEIVEWDSMRLAYYRNLS